MWGVSYWVRFDLSLPTIVQYTIQTNNRSGLPRDLWPLLARHAPRAPNSLERRWPATLPFNGPKPNDSLHLGRGRRKPQTAVHCRLLRDHNLPRYFLPVGTMATPPWPPGSEYLND